MFVSPRAEADPAQVNMQLTAPLVLGMGAAWVGSEFAKETLAPAHCRWCAPGALDERVTHALWAGGGGHADAAALSTDVLAFGVVPGLMLGSTLLPDARSTERGYADTAIVLEAGVAAAVLNQGTKFLVGRERPFVHALADSEKAGTASPSDNNLSFYSGHTSFTFAVAASATTVAAMRGSKAAPWVGVIGGGLAFATGVGRVVAGKHYASDVALGALTGSLLGVGVPLVFHQRGASLRASLADGGGSLSCVGTW